MSTDQYNGPGFHLSIAKYDSFKPRRLTKRQQADADKQSADLAKWCAKNSVPCVKCRRPHFIIEGSHCIVCAVHTPESEQRSHVTIGPKKS
ncbi:hypothetical protein BEN47_16760 [Hymenobacter lapidarius]|uniref:Uncharacterized protein n=1 Tax=Hymenobacter lapidarius TaxID=1908237 RepID=A0A1G1SZS9_9BACT|nr:hypothetical protein [Hymenobacter lapidarius]OGX84128.1 hypothetical protein BEN47_16760 [Hymenobacter lapidarius]